MSEDQVSYWYRRALHAFASIFIAYYLLPDHGEWSVVKKIAVILSISIFTALEIYRIISKRNLLFGLRDYEKNRFGSYLYFGIGAAVLLLLFEQQISIPCIVSASLIDPVAGEMRKRGALYAYALSVTLSFAIFLVVWYNSPSPFSIIVPLIAALAITAGEFKKSKLLDDDLVMQILPAVVIAILYYLVMQIYGISILPDKIIYPIFGVDA
ncbi:MAG TPA: dolichol kinase [Thermoplasmatales archaeon]|nr:dolichol kinase [Thermoplasmatales archaeon]